MLQTLYLVSVSGTAPARGRHGRDVRGA
jgi:hypothetical protein